MELSSPLILIHFADIYELNTKLLKITLQAKLFKTAFLSMLSTLFSSLIGSHCLCFFGIVSVMCKQCHVSLFHSLHSRLSFDTLLCYLCMFSIFTITSLFVLYKYVWYLLVSYRLSEVWLIASLSGIELYCSLYFSNSILILKTSKYILKMLNIFMLKPHPNFSHIFECKRCFFFPYIVKII